MRTNLCFESSQPSGRLSSEIRVAGIQRRTPIGPASIVESWQLHLGNLRDKLSSFARILFLFFGTSGTGLISRFCGDTDDAVIASCLLISSETPGPNAAVSPYQRGGRRKSDEECSCETTELYTAIALSSQIKYHSVWLLILSVTFRL